MTGYENFHRDYRMIAGPAKMAGFEIGYTTPDCPLPLHIDFALQKSDLESQNTGHVTVWNLNKSHLAILNQKDCGLALRAGYNGRLSLIFAGIISHVKTSADGADKKTEIDVVDNLVEVRDTYISVAYNGVVNWRQIFDDVARQMGVAISYAYNVKFANVNNGFSFIGAAKNVLSKGCDCCGLSWSLQNGVIQIKRPNDVMSREVFVLSSETGLINIPSQISIEKGSGKDKKEKQPGWEVEYLLNGAINVDSYVRLESKHITGYFRVHSIEISGDNMSGDWMCKAKLLEVKG